MEQNPLEQKNIKINTARQKLKGKLESIFDEDNKNRKKITEIIDKFILHLETLEKNGLIFNKEEIIKGLKEGVEIEDKEEFVSHFLKTLEPIVILQVTQANIFEKTERRNMLYNEAGNFKLSEVLYTGFSGKEAHIHLAPSVEFIKEKGIANFKNEVKNGLIKLAEVLKSNKEIEEITAASWIVAKNPALLEQLGFTIIGEISKKEKDRHFEDEKRSIVKASIKREKFDEWYGNKEKFN